MFPPLESTRTLAVHPSVLTNEQQEVLDAGYAEAARSGFLERYQQALGNLATRQEASMLFVSKMLDAEPSKLDQLMLNQIRQARRAEADVTYRLSNIQGADHLWYLEAMKLMRGMSDDGQGEVTHELPGSRVIIAQVQAGFSPVDKVHAPFIAADIHLAIAGSSLLRGSGVHLDADYADGYSQWLADDDPR